MSPLSVSTIYIVALLFTFRNDLDVWGSNEMLTIPIITIPQKYDN